MEVIKLEQTKNVYRFIFSDGVIIEKDWAHQILNFYKKKIVSLNLKKNS